MAAERKLRERLRAQLGMAPRPRRTEINRYEHVRRFGIEANPELPKTATKKSHSDKKLQTLKFPDELEATIEKIADDARSAEQEMGLSTLFLSFGFLEWYESDTSDKKHFAPLLLLPVKLDSRKVQGKKVFSISATAGSVESNLTLQKYLERDFSRILPDFEPEDEESAGSIEAYLSQIQKTIDGLNRWRVCRWLVLGHFAFGRLAMYADLAAERWKYHPAGHKLVQSVLRGTEDGNGSVLPSIPDDYFIDDPEVEKIAPFLIHDADASQHSALVDVMKGGSLVIQGPPGTGKSQTITNIIANALALGKKVLFLSEKQAALEVVKRRLDQAKLGQFCLEIHSDKSSSKQIIASLKRRIELGFGTGRTPAAQSVDLTWQDSRKAISEYLTALHAAADDGRTPFLLMWRSIRGRSLDTDLIGLFKNVQLPDTLLKNPSDIPASLGQLEIYASAAQAFNDAHGHPAQSAWVGLGIDFLPSYEIEPLMDTLEELKGAAETLWSIARQNGDLFSAHVDELRCVVSAASRLHHPPSDRLLAQIVALDLTELERALEVYQSLEIVLIDLRAKADLSAYPTRILALADTIAERESRLKLFELTPAQLADDVARRIDELEIILAAIVGLLPALEVIGFDKSFKVECLEAIAIAVIITSNLQPEHRPWLGRFREIDFESFESARAQWIGLVAAENKWRSRLDNPRTPWPSATEIATAAKTIGKGHVGKLFAKIGGAGRVAKELIERLAFSNGSLPTSDELAELASHVAALESFLSDSDVRGLVGARQSRRKDRQD